jgi:hypothetical protein
MYRGIAAELEKLEVKEDLTTFAACVSVLLARLEARRVFAVRYKPQVVFSVTA